MKSHEHLAQALSQAWSGGPVVELNEYEPVVSRGQAYAIQDRTADLLGYNVAGWKVGATSRAVQEFEGHDGPIPGRIFAQRLFQSPAVAQASDFPKVKVECEIAVRFDKVPPRTGSPYTVSELKPLMSLYVALELAGPRIVKASTFGTFDLIADNGFGAGLVVGPKVSSFDILELEITATVGRHTQVPINGREMRSDPFEVAVETLNDLALRDLGMTEGQYISTGSISTPVPLEIGETARAVYRIGSNVIGEVVFGLV